ncbi:LON peptidase substrate-binding domain-containing protein [bacterium]|nr:LON peptidase substrate-binding domain-containing protein [bacterium]
MADAEELVALFPLPNVVLFPEVDLPLHVFEPRYREMVADAMEGDRRIGMVLLRGDWRRDYQGSPPVFPLGCAGRIERFERLADGRSNLLLTGRRRFEVVEEVPGKPYRRAKVRWREEPGLPDRAAASTAVERLRSTITPLFEGSASSLPESWWEGMPDALGALVNRLGFALDLDPVEKLSLLECDEATARCDRLVEMLQFLAAERRLGTGGGRGEGPWH